MKQFTPFQLGRIELKNRIVMAPLTRCRAPQNIPNELIAEYYAQRASAGLLITEGTSPSPNGLGYMNIPGAYSKEQTEGWKLVADAVHAKKGHVFMQLMHTGRSSHQDNLPENGRVLGPSAIGVGGARSTYKGKQDNPVPEVMTEKDIQEAIKEFAQAAANAIEAGLDGVEIHAANGYLVDQFLNTASNKREDKYGGSIENRCRFAIEVARAIVDRIGADRCGIRLSPYGVYNGMEIYEGMDECFLYLAKELGKIGLVYIHLVDHSSMGAPEVPMRIKEGIKEAFGGVVIDSGGMNKEKGEQAIENGFELVAYGKFYISNPDLVEKLKSDTPFAMFNPETFYSPGADGYTDY